MDVEELFKTLRHDATLTAMMLVMLEAAGGEPVEIADSGVWKTQRQALSDAASESNRNGKGG